MMNSHPPEAGAPDAIETKIAPAILVWYMMRTHEKSIGGKTGHSQ
jgi:hypothetical protein